MNGSDLIFKMKELYTPEVKEILKKLGEIGKKVEIGGLWEENPEELWEAYDLTVKLNGMFESHFSVKDLVLSWDEIAEEDSIARIIRNSMYLCNVFFNPSLIRSALTYAYLQVKDPLGDDENKHLEDKVLFLTDEGDIVLMGIAAMTSIAEIRKDITKRYFKNPIE